MAGVLDVPRDDAEIGRGWKEMFVVDFDALKDKAEGLVGEHADEVKQGIDKAGDFVAGKFGHGGQVQGVQSTLSGLVDKIARERGAAPAS